MADEDKENLPVEPQLKRAYLSLSLPKDRFSFSVDDKDLEEAMKKYSVKTLRSITSRLLKTLRTGLKQSAIQPKYHLMFSSLMIQLFSVIRCVYTSKRQWNSIQSKKPLFAVGRATKANQA